MNIGHSICTFSVFRTCLLESTECLPLSLQRQLTTHPENKMAENIEIRLASTTSEYEDVKKIVLEYSNWLGFDLSFQNFEKEMETLPITYGPPDGGIFLAFRNNEAVGVAGIKRFSDSECELKRMFIREHGRGYGIGKLLLSECISLAAELNYSKIKLDTMAYMKSAIKIYTDSGFIEIPAYCFNPNEEARYFELILK